MRRVTGPPRGALYALVDERETLLRRIESRGQTVKALTDGDRAMLFVLFAVGSIWAVEIIANLTNVSGWVKWAHLSVIGALEVGVVYCLVAAARVAVLRRRLRQIDQRLHQLIP